MSKEKKTQKYYLKEGKKNMYSLGGIDMNQEKAKIFCRKNDAGTLNFYIEINKKGNSRKVYLFTTRFYSSQIENEFRNGKYLYKIFENTNQIRQQGIRSRIIRMIGFIEMECDVKLLKKSKESSYKPSVKYSMTKDNKDNYYYDDETA